MPLDLDKLKMQVLKTDDRSIDSIFDHISNGGSLTELCTMWGLRYSDVIKVIKANPDYKSRYDQSLTDRDEWAKERILSEVKRMSIYTIKDIFHPDGTHKKPHEMPDDLLAAIKEIDADGGIKFQDKLKALDLLGKQLGLFIDKKEISGTMTLEQMIIASTASKDNK